MSDTKHRKRGCTSPISDDLLKKLCTESQESTRQHLNEEAVLLESQNVARSCENACDNLSSSVELGSQCAKSIHINELPAIVLLKVFSNLSLNDRQHAVALVCHYWLQLSRDSALWKCINLAGLKSVTDSVLSLLISYGSAVRQIDLTDCCGVTDNGVMSALSTCPKLQKLKLLRCMQLSDAAFRCLSFPAAGACLTELDVSHCHHITDETLLKVAMRCHQLTHLSVNQCSKLSDVGLSAIVSSCPRLRYLSVDDCNKLTDESLENLAASCRDIQHFSCKCCNFSAAAVALCSQLKALQFLDLTGVRTVNDKTVCAIADGCKRLTTVNLSLCTGVTDVGVEFLARHAQQLSTIYLVSCTITSHSMQSLARYRRASLEVIDVGYCSNIDDDSVVELSRSCSRLRYVGLMRCDNVSMSTTLTLVDSFPHINYSTAYLEFKRLIDKAQAQGYQFSEPTGVVRTYSE